MKKSIALSVIALMGLSAAAQHEYLHIYRNSKAFTSQKAADIENINFLSTEWGDKTDAVELKLKDGTMQSVSVSDIDKTVIGRNVPVIRVNLTDYPDLEDLIKDATHTKSTIYAATLSMDGSGFFDDIPETEVEFRGRGNSTWNMKKTPYRFKLPKKQSVCGLAKAKSFALIANYIDCSLMRNAIALKVANMLEMPFSNHCVPVTVYLNSHYKGAYMLTEKIGIGGGSVDINEDEGILFEFDSNYDEDFRFKYYFEAGNLPVMVKDPDLVEIAEKDLTGATTAQNLFDRWRDDITVMLDAVTQRSPEESLSDVLDLESAVNFLIVNNLACNQELCHPKSFYIYKEALGSDYKYHFGPVWDFDWAFTFNGAEGAPYDNVLFNKNGDAAGASFFQLLFKNQEFRSLYEKKWNEFVTTIYPELLKYLDEYADHIEPSAIKNGTIWPADYSISWRRSECSFEFRKNYAALMDWLNNRVDFISGHRNFGLYE